jgi:hypothetical protein
MKLYLPKVHNMQSFFQKFYITKILRMDNEKADCLARIAYVESNGKEESKESIHVLTHPSISDQVLVWATI